MDWITVAIWVLTGLIIVGGIVSLRSTKAIYKFILWFACSLIGLTFVLGLLGDSIATAIIIAVVISVLGVKDE